MGEHGLSDPVRERLDEVDRVTRDDCGDRFGELAVVDRVGDVIGLGGTRR